MFTVKRTVWSFLWRILVLFRIEWIKCCHCSVLSIKIEPIIARYLSINSFIWWSSHIILHFEITGSESSNFKNFTFDSTFLHRFLFLVIDFCTSSHICNEIVVIDQNLHLLKNRWNESNVDSTFIYKLHVVINLSEYLLSPFKAPHRIVTLFPLVLFRI